MAGRYPEVDTISISLQDKKRHPRSTAMYRSHVARVVVPLQWLAPTRLLWWEKFLGDDKKTCPQQLFAFDYTVSLMKNVLLGTLVPFS